MKKPGDKDYLNEMAKAVHDRLPDNYCFIVFAFPVGKDGRIFYASNAQRADAVAALKAWLLKTSPENWLTHFEE